MLICASCAREPYEGNIARPKPAGGSQIDCCTAGISAPSVDGFMAEMGHKPAYLSPSGAGGMSAMTARVSEFCAVQQLEVSAINRHNRQSFDLLVGAQQNRGRHCKAKRLGGLEVHGHLVCHRKLHRKIARRST